MRLIGKSRLLKLGAKNRGNRKLKEEIDKLIDTIEECFWKNQMDIMADRPDADCVHADGFFIFDIAVHRTMILVEFDESQATIAWAGTHENYEQIFKNNKSTIAKWLRARGYIE